MKQLILARCTTPPLRFNKKALIILLAKVFIACLASQTVLAAPMDDFVTTWKTDNPGPSNDRTIEVPMIGGPYDVDWNNDGTFDEFGISGAATHQYMVAGIYTIRIRGSFDAIRVTKWGDREKIISLDQWGTNKWKSMYAAFHRAINLQVLATDTPDLSDVKNMWQMFSRTGLNNPDVGDWDTSAVVNMAGMFSQTSLANPDVSDWDTSKVTNMDGMFSLTSSANPDVSGWDTSAVKSMGSMFYSAASANPDVSGWDTSAVWNMSSMFNRASLANPDVSGWDTSKVIDMSGMFKHASLANPDVSGWDTSAVTLMLYMFSGATSFNQDIGSWDVTSLKRASGMFNGVKLSTENYENLLIGWSSQEVISGVDFSGGNSTYCSADAIAARNVLTENFFWTILDGGKACPTDPPTGIRATDGVYPDFVRITFNPVAGATVYRVFRCLDNGYTCGLPIGYVNTPTFNDTKGNSEQVYYYRVKACVANKCGKFSAARTGFTTPAPDHPTGIRATDGSFEDRVQITFNTVDGATVYRVFRCLDKGYTCGLPIAYPTMGRFDDRKGDAGTVYYYRVKACRVSTCGKFSAANAGHRGETHSSKSDQTNALMLLGQDVSIPTLSAFGRWLLILMTLGLGSLLVNHRCDWQRE